MRVRRARIALSVLVLLVVLSCSRDVNIPTLTDPKLNSGRCAGCLTGVEDSLFSFVVKTHADYKVLIANCFVEHVRREWLPPRPGPNEQLVYVSLRGGGCKGCLDIVSTHETAEDIVVEVAGGFQGECDMLIVPGAWALIPETEKPINFNFHEAVCPDEM